MQIKRDVAEPFVVVSLSGRLEGTAAGQLESILLAEIHEQRNILIDLTGVGFVGSAGLRVLLLAHGTALTRACSIRLCGLRPNVLRLFELCRMESVFRMHGTLDEALMDARDGGRCGR